MVYIVVIITGSFYFDGNRLIVYPYLLYRVSQKYRTALTYFASNVFFISKMRDKDLRSKENRFFTELFSDSYNENRSVVFARSVFRFRRVKKFSFSFDKTTGKFRQYCLESNMVSEKRMVPYIGY